MQNGDQHPNQAQQASDQEGVVDPQPAARINTHQNTCSAERAFWCKTGPRYKRVTLVGLVLLGLCAGCLPDPQTLQSRELLDMLVSARSLFGAQPPQFDAGCNMVGDVQTRLFGEPGLVDIRPAWPALRDAAEALQAVCGQSILLGQPTPDGSYALDQAHARWRQGIQRELGVACDHLLDAAAALDRPPPC